MTIEISEEDLQEFLDELQYFRTNYLHDEEAKEALSDLIINFKEKSNIEDI